MQKTFCDRCGDRCDGFYLDLRAQGFSTTSDGVVAEELYASKRPPQLCKGCVHWLSGEGIDFGLVSSAELEQRKGENRVMRNPDTESDAPLAAWDPVPGSYGVPQAEVRTHP